MPQQSKWPNLNAEAEAMRFGIGAQAGRPKSKAQSFSEQALVKHLNHLPVKLGIAELYQRIDRPRIV